MKSHTLAFALTLLALISAALAGVVHTNSSNSTKIVIGSRGDDVQHDVYSPQIYAPTQGAVWTPGTQQLVEW